MACKHSGDCIRLGWVNQSYQRFLHKRINTECTEKSKEDANSESSENLERKRGYNGRLY